ERWRRAELAGRERQRHRPPPERGEVAHAELADRGDRHRDVELGVEPERTAVALRRIELAELEPRGILEIRNVERRNIEQDVDRSKREPRRVAVGSAR